MHWLGVTRVLKAAGDVNLRYIPAEALERGTRFHALTVAWDQREEVDIPDDLTGPLEAYQRALGEVRPRWLKTEHDVQHDALRVRGRLDRYGLVFGVTAVVDLKLGDPQEWHGTQLFAYWLLLGDLTAKRYALYCGNDGRYHLKEYPDNMADMRRFYAALARARTADHVDADRGPEWEVDEHFDIE